MKARQLLILLITIIADSFLGITAYLWDISLGQYIEIHPFIDSAFYTGLSAIIPMAEGIVVPVSFYALVLVVFDFLPRLGFFKREVNLTLMLLAANGGARQELPA